MNQAARERYAALYRSTYADVLGFVARRLGGADSSGLARAEDVTHETFLIAWRRFAAVPEDYGAARAWLFTTARNCLLNDQRAAARHRALQVKIADAAADAESAPSAPSSHPNLAAAWAALTPEHQEAISLVAWDELTAKQAAQTLGISETAFRSRLSRARAQLRQNLNKPQ